MNFMDVTIGTLSEDEIGEFAEVVNSVFDEFVGPEYSEEGRSTFREYASGGAIAERMRGKDGLFIAAREKGAVIGALEVRKGDHIALFFVKSGSHGKGIGRQLFSHYLEILEKSYPSVSRISVNSSPYAERIYQKLGFRKTGEPCERDGIRFIPMEYKTASEDARP